MYWVIMIGEGARPYVYGPYALNEAQKERNSRLEVYEPIGYTIKILKEVEDG